MTATETLARSTRDPASATLIGGLALAAIALVIQILTGVPGFPPIPPGPIILTGAALFVALAPWRWAPIVGFAAAVFLVVGLLLSESGTAERLGDPARFGPFMGTGLFLIGLLTALVAGAWATVRVFRPTDR